MAENLELVVSARNTAKAALREARADVRALETAVVAAGRRLAAGTMGAEQVRELEQQLARARNQVRQLGTEYGRLDSRMNAGRIRQSTSAVDRLSASWKRNETAVRMAGLGMAYGVARFTKSAFDAAQEAQKSNARLEQVFKSMGDVSGQAAQWSEDYAGSQQYIVGVDDEVIKGGMAKLATFRDVSSEVARSEGIYQRATDAAVDLSATGFGDLESSSVQLGKALQDPLKGMTALRKSGSLNSDDILRIGTAFKETGDLVAAQKSILGAVESQVHGVAAAMATDADRANISWGEFQETVGNDVMPTITSFLNAGGKVLQFVGGLPAPVRFAAYGIGALGIAAMIAGPRILSMRTSLIQARVAAGTLGTTTGVTAGKIGMIGTAATAATIALIALNAAQDGVNGVLAKDAPGADQFASAFQKIAEGGTVDLPKTAAGVDALAMSFDTGTQNVDDMLNRINGAGSVWNKIGDWKHSVDPFGGKAPEITKINDYFTSLNSGLEEYKKTASSADFEKVISGIGAASNANSEHPEKLKQLQQVLPSIAEDLGTVAKGGHLAASGLSATGKAAGDATRMMQGVAAISSALDNSANADSLTQKYKDLGKSVADNKNQWKGSSDAALANRDALRQVVTQQMALAKSHVESRGIDISTDQTGALDAELAKIQAKWDSKMKNLGIGPIKVPTDLLAQFTEVDVKQNAINDKTLTPKTDNAQLSGTDAVVLGIGDHLNALENRPPVIIDIVEKTTKEGPGGDTPHGFGVGGFGATMAAHNRHMATVSGVSILSGVRGHNLGSTGSDHASGRALDLVGRGTNNYARAVKAAGGYAAFHGSGSSRHLHAVPNTRRTKAIAAGAGGGGTRVSESHYNTPITFTGPVSEGADIEGITMRAVRAADAEQRRLQRSRS